MLPALYAMAGGSNDRSFEPLRFKVHAHYWIPRPTTKASTSSFRPAARHAYHRLERPETTSTHDKHLLDKCRPVPAPAGLILP